MYFRHKNEFVNQGAGEWGRAMVYTKPIECYFSVFKRDMKATYQHCSKQHLIAIYPSSNSDRIREKA